jgi:hypothetical protein
MSIPYGKIPRNEILQIEKQILRDIATEIKQHVSIIKWQPSSRFLLPTVNATNALDALAERLKELAE